MQERPKRPKAVIIGGGFDGLYAAKALSHAAVEVTLIDRKNHHTFQPLLYQVALAVLSPGEIASPLRHILRKARNVHTLLSAVAGCDTAARRVQLSNGAALAYDYLIVAAGARHAYFGHDEWERDAPGLKTIGRCLTGVDVLYSTPSLNPILPNTIECDHDSPSPALSPLPRDRYCPPWPDSAREATLPLPRATLCQSYLPPGL